MKIEPRIIIEEIKRFGASDLEHFYFRLHLSQTGYVHILLYIRSSWFLVVQC